MSTLLDKVRAVKIGRKSNIVASSEDVDVCISWAHGEISAAQISKVLRLRSDIYGYLARGFREGIRNKRIKV